MLNYSPAATHCCNVSLTPTRSSLSKSSPSSSLPHSLSFSSALVTQQLASRHVYANTNTNIKRKPLHKGLKIMCSTSEPLKVMISGAPASGKGTQCEMIVEKFGLVHVSTGDLLRAEVSAGTEIGNKAKEYMNSGHLVPDEIVTAMVTTRLSLKDAQEKGWLLDGYPRSFAQAESLEKKNIRPDEIVEACCILILLLEKKRRRRRSK